MGIKISDLPEAVTLDGTEVFPAVQSSTTKKTLLSLLRTWLFTNPIALGSGTPAAITGTTITASSQFNGPATGLTGTAGIDITGWAKNAGAATNIASAATIDFTTRTGNIVRITGTTATSAITMSSGDRIYCIADAAWPLTYNATTMPIPGGGSTVCSSGDIICFTKDVSGNFSVEVHRKQISPLTATIVDRKYAENTSYIGYTGAAAVIPVDDTIPQTTEGELILSITIAPKSTNNRLRIRGLIIGANDTASAVTTAALFTSASTNAIAAIPISQPSANALVELSLEVEIAPATTSTLTITLRLGIQNAGHGFRINGTSSGRLFGGSSRCTLVVEEISL